MTQVDERLARLETKMDLVTSQLATIGKKIDGKLNALELDVARLKLQVKWLIGVISVLFAASGTAVAVAQKVMGEP
jgi:hypothetical protein